MKLRAVAAHVGKLHPRPVGAIRRHEMSRCSRTRADGRGPGPDRDGEP